QGEGDGVAKGDQVGYRQDFAADVGGLANGFEVGADFFSVDQELEEAAAGLGGGGGPHLGGQVVGRPAASSLFRALVGDRKSRRRPQPALSKRVHSRQCGA